MKFIHLFLLFVIFLEPNGPFLGIYRLDNFYLIILPIILINWIIKSYKIKVNVIELTAIIAIFLLSLNFLISMFITNDVNLGIYDAYLRIFLGVIVGRMIANSPNLSNKFTIIIYVSIIISGIILLINIIDRRMFLDLYFRYMGSPTVQWRFGGFFDLPYTLAVWVVFSSFFILERTNKLSHSIVIQILLHLQGLLTFSKTYILGAFILVLARNRKLKVLMKIMIGCLILLIVYGTTSQIAEFIKSQIGRNPFDIILSRYLDGGQTSNIVIQNFVFGSFGLKPEFATDNGYFEIYYYFGIIGLLVFFIFITLVFIKLSVNWKLFMAFLIVASFGSSAFAANKMTLMMWSYLGIKTKRKN